VFCFFFVYSFFFLMNEYGSWMRILAWLQQCTYTRWPTVRNTNTTYWRRHWIGPWNYGLWITCSSLCSNFWAPHAITFVTSSGLLPTRLSFWPSHQPRLPVEHGEIDDRTCGYSHCVFCCC
jgi:hypothetical protein